MLKPSIQFILATAGLLACAAAAGQAGAPPAGAWQKDFDLSACKLKTTGRNDYFILEPGFQLHLEGEGARLLVTVTAETKEVGGVSTRVVEEREWKGGELYEVARNYFAICEQTGDVFYFGEDVEFYEKGRVVKRDGTWHAGVNGAKAGLIMPGRPARGMKYYQEIAPGVAMDRAEIVSLNTTCKTPAGTFKNCMKVKEGSALEPAMVEYKYYAPGVGLVADEDLRLVKYGFGK